MAFERELDVARSLARQAAEVALSHRRRGVQAQTKLDLSPVTEADRESERLIGRVLEETFPGDGILGEEGAKKASSTGRRWIVDPLDGTRDYLRGHPTWGVLIGLEAGAGVAMGICYLPEREEMYHAVRGGGAYCNDARIRTSAIADVAQSVLCVNGYTAALGMPFAPRLLEWMGRFWAVRSFGGCQDAMYVADGKAEAWLEPHAEPWDLAALKIITEEAGAVFFNFNGASSIYGGNCAVCVPALETVLRKFILGAERADTNARVQAPL